MIKLSTTLEMHELQILANVDQNDFWRLVKKVVDGQLGAMEGEVRQSPKLCDEDLTEDLRYKMGGIDRLKWVLELPSEARDILKQR
jgi:G:T/U-mismatch repair DNA glycosylase